MSSYSDSEGEEEGEVLGKWRGYHVGDCVSYEVEGLRNIESQGVIFSIVKDETGEIWVELNLMQRAPPSPLWDTNNPRLIAYRYIDLDEMQWVRGEQLLCTVHLEFVPGDEKKLNKGLLMDSLPSDVRKGGVMYYKNGPGGVQGAPMELKLRWYHFDREHLRNLEWREKRCLKMDEEDLTLGFLSHLKPVIFDPFVSPFSYTHRHPSPHWNIRTWKLLLRATQDKTLQLDYELEKLQKPRSEDIIKKEELFIVEGVGILKFILILLREWCLLDPREVSIYDVMQYISHHQKIVGLFIKKLSNQIEREAYAQDSTGSDVSDISEHMSFGGGEDSSEEGGDDEEEEGEDSSEEGGEEEGDFSSDDSTIE